MPRKIIICCDGTGNEIKENQSNVLKFYRVLKKDNSQIAFYDPGVGTISNSGAWAAIKNKSKGVFGLATGYGLDANVLDAYHFLVQNYKPEDEIYLFGFSRGAHTVRVLAGFINLVGVLHPEQLHLGSYALTAYKQSSNTDKGEIAWRVQEVLDTRRVTIRFMGCWDTVASVIVPRPDRFYFPSTETLLATEENPSVKVFRHAMAIDERRRMFRLSRWKEPQLFKTNPYVPDEKADKQDIEQVWFAGVHSDIGGGYPEQESSAAKYPLGWMVEEAKQHGLVFRETMVKRLVKGQNPKNVKKGDERFYEAPTPDSKLHNSMNWGWRILEYLPKNKKHHDHPETKSHTGAYFPRSEPRYIPPEATIHPSVGKRVKTGNYSPPISPRHPPSPVPNRSPC